MMGYIFGKDINMRKQNKLMGSKRAQRATAAV